MIKSISIYCASSTQINKEYIDSAYRLGEILAQNGIITIYGGGSVGSMGAIADAVLLNKGHLVGVIPRFMMELEWGHPSATEMHVVDTMAERKQQFIDKADAIVALPGGTGTLEELAEAISLKKLGLCPKPIVILNTNGFYDHFIKFIEQMIHEHFMRKEHIELFSVANKPEEVLDKIKNAPDWSNIAIKLAAI